MEPGCERNSCRQSKKGLKKDRGKGKETKEMWEKNEDRIGELDALGKGRLRRRGRGRKREEKREGRDKWEEGARGGSEGNKRG